MIAWKNWKKITVNLSIVDICPRLEPGTFRVKVTNFAACDNLLIARNVLFVSSDSVVETTDFIFKSHR
jgi:hypothetical protein